MINDEKECEVEDWSQALINIEVRLICCSDGIQPFIGKFQTRTA